MATYQLGKDVTVSGFSGVRDVSFTAEAEQVDITTRDTTGNGYKQMAAGFTTNTIELTVLGDASKSVGSSVSVTSSIGSVSGIIVSAQRSEPIDDVISYKLTIKPGNAAASPQSI